MSYINIRQRERHARAIDNNYRITIYIYIFVNGNQKVRARPSH